jgi:hypothetical protein
VPRDDRLDVWRGLCLVDVVLVHLAFAGLGFPGPLDETIKQYTRFAAGGFVFLAGLTIGVVFWPNVLRSAAARRGVYERLWRRAIVLIAVEIGASVAFRLLDPIRWFPSDPDTSLAEGLLGIVLFHRSGVMGGILILYAILLSALPAVFELRRRAGDAAVVALSLGLYAVAWGSGGLLWPRGEFPVAYWQPVFLAGLLAARAWDRVRIRDRRWAIAWVATATVAFAGVFVLHHGPTFGIVAPARLVQLAFEKNPLQPGAVLWYLTIVQLVLAWTHLGWDRVLSGTRCSAWLALLGRHSLLFYTAHVFTEIPIMEFLWQAWPPALVRVALAGADLAALTALCSAVEHGLPSLVTQRPRVVRAGAMLAVATSLAAVVVTDNPIRPLEMTVVDDADTIGDFIGPVSDPDMSYEFEDGPDLQSAEPEVTLG